MSICSIFRLACSRVSEQILESSSPFSYSSTDFSNVISSFDNSSTIRSSCSRASSNDGRSSGAILLYKSISNFGSIQTTDLKKHHVICESKLLSRSEEHTSELQSRGHLVCRL